MVLNDLKNGTPVVELARRVSQACVLLTYFTSGVSGACVLSILGLVCVTYTHAVTWELLLKHINRAAVINIHTDRILSHKSYN